MPRYRYKARDQFGVLATGTIEAGGRDAVATQLDGLGYIPVKIEEDSAVRRDLDLSFLHPVRAQDLIVFSRQLATLISAGLPFMRSFDTLVEQTQHPKLRAVIEAVRRDVEAGGGFADALARHPKIFSPLYVSMIRAGEVSGTLDEILQRLATLAEHDAQTRARIKTATRYPKIVLSVLGVGIVILISFVVPRFAAMYDNFKAELPLPTRILIALNDFAQSYGWLVLGVGAAAAFGFWKYVRTESGRLWWDGVKLKLPIFGPIFLKTALSRFARVFGTLTHSGLPVLQTLEIVGDTVGNVVIARVVSNIRDSARTGRGLVPPMRVSRVFPPVVIQMVAVGEETGKMEQMLLKVSDYYDEEVEYAVRNLATSLEPLLLGVIGVVVLFLALAIFMPWWNLINVFKGGG